MWRAASTLDLWMLNLFPSLAHQMSYQSCAGIELYLLNCGLISTSEPPDDLLILECALGFIAQGFLLTVLLLMLLLAVKFH